jgi:alkanesulfonate monooxygenase SsuD/methylene tetrahydromethanopterin reductase-like flavin-dependent oxidoreductase (luciferase family)
MRANGVPQGLIDELNQLARVAAHDELLEQAAQLVDETVARTVVACGTATQVRAKVREYIQAGATLPVLVALDDGVRPMIDALARGYTEPSQSWLVESL